MCIYSPNEATLQALRGSNIELMMDVVGETLQSLTDPNQGTNNFGYQNLFDAMLDSKYTALEKMGAPNLEIVVSESGWPSLGGDGALVENAHAY
ncbi:hypothetical protein JHK87_044964 [Glycine soja]|nr:hypothetical protein JHK87_044964 [Glycine soja]